MMHSRPTRGCCHDQRFSRLLVMSAGAFLAGPWSLVARFQRPSSISDRFAQTIIASDDPSRPKTTLQPGLHRLDGRGRGIKSLYVSNDLIVFANTDGDAIAFDGWTIRSVVGFGLKEPFPYQVKTVSEPSRCQVKKRRLNVMSGVSQN